MSMSFYYFLRSITPKNHLRLIRDHLDIQPDDAVLEVGCGRGETLARLRQDGVEAVGIDGEYQNVAKARTPILLMKAEDLKFSKESFDKIFSFHLIEHLTNPLAALKEMVRVLKIGGLLLLTYPAEPIRGLFALPAAISLYGNPFKARQIHRHRLTPTDLLKLGKQSELEAKFSETSVWPPEHLALFVKT